MTGSISAAGLWALNLGLIAVSVAQPTSIIVTLVSGLSGPFQLGSDGAGGYFVAVIGSSSILRGWANGSTITVASALGVSWGGATTNGAGGFYYNVNSSRIVEKNFTGAARIVAGTGPNGFSGDGGPATAAVLNQPYGMGEDGAGGIYISDTFNHVRKQQVSSSLGRQLS